MQTCYRPYLHLMPTLLILPNLSKLSGPGKAFCEQAGAGGLLLWHEKAKEILQINEPLHMMKRIALATVTSCMHDISVPMQP